MPTQFAGASSRPQPMHCHAVIVSGASKDLVSAAAISIVLSLRRSATQLLHSRGVARRRAAVSSTTDLWEDGSVNRSVGGRGGHVAHDSGRPKWLGGQFPS